MGGICDETEEYVMADWILPVFGTLLIPLFIILIVTYFITKKISRLMFVVSLFTYTIGILFLIDKYDMSKNAIIITLIISAIILMYIGYYMIKRKY